MFFIVSLVLTSGQFDNIFLYGQPERFELWETFRRINGTTVSSPFTRHLSLWQHARKQTQCRYPRFPFNWKGRWDRYYCMEARSGEVVEKRDCDPNCQLLSQKSFIMLAASAANTSLHSIYYEFMLWASNHDSWVELALYSPPKLENTKASDLNYQLTKVSDSITQTSLTSALTEFSENFLLWVEATNISAVTDLEMSLETLVSLDVTFPWCMYPTVKDVCFP